MTFRVSCLLAALIVPMFAPRAQGADDAAVAEVRAGADKIAQAFNAGNVDQIVAGFLPDGEWIDENGTIYQGTQELKQVLTSFFKKFPGAKLTLNIESVRLIGPLAIDEGTRVVTTKDGEARADLRYVAVRVKSDRGWKIASLRDFNESPPLTPHDQLQGLAWLVGDWVNEGSDDRVQISFRWSEDKNFLIGDYIVTRGNQKRVSSQRIGWDPLLGNPRSWLFDADGGYSEGRWTLVDDAWVMKSSAVSPDGETATATITLKPTDADHFSMRGADRIVGGGREPDFDVVVVRRPPAARK